MATTLDQVRTLIERLAPEPICDHCVSERLGLGVSQNANHRTRELAGGDGFERDRDDCSMCGSHTLVIRKRTR